MISNKKLKINYKIQLNKCIKIRILKYAFKIFIIIIKTSREDANN
jgi:hypothetical protein